MPFSQILLAIAIVAAWGFNAAVSKVVVTQLPTLAFLSLRFFTTALVFFPFSKLHKSNIIPLFKIAILLNIGHFGFIFYSLKYLSASSLSVIQQIQVPMALVLGAIFLKEKLSFRQTIGIILALCGILCIYGLPELNIIGLLLALGGSFFWAISQLEIKKTQTIDIYTFITYTTLMSSPILLLMSLFFEGNLITAIEQAPKIPLAFSFFYQVVILGGAMMLWQKLIANNGISKVVPIMLLQVVFGILGGIIIFHEQLSLNIIIGALFTTTGVALAVIKKKAK